MKLSTLIKSIFVTISVVILSACTVTTGRTDIKDEDVKQFVVGPSTYKEVIQKLGKPNSDRVQKMMVNGKDMSMHYVIYDMSTSESNFSGAHLIPLVGAFVGKTEIKTTTKRHTFLFDPKTGVLKQVGTVDMGESNSKSEGLMSGNLGTVTTDGQTVTGKDILMGSETNPTTRSITK